MNNLKEVLFKDQNTLAIEKECTIQFKGTIVRCREDENLRSVLLKNDLSPYNDSTGLINCRGLGTCGTCAVQISGEVSPMTRIEKWRLTFPPHKLNTGLRLACQCKINGDLVVTKRPGFWGQHPLR